MDNCGFELFTDLCLADFLITSKIVNFRINLKILFKKIPISYNISIVYRLTAKNPKTRNKLKKTRNFQYVTPAQPEPEKTRPDQRKLNPIATCN